MKRYTLTLLLLLAGLGADPNCSQQVGQRGMEEAADRIGQKIEVVGNKFDPLLVELTRLVRVSADWLERGSSAARGAPEVTPPARSDPEPLGFPWFVDERVLGGFASAVALALGALARAHYANKAKVDDAHKKIANGGTK